MKGAIPCDLSDEAENGNESPKDAIDVDQSADSCESDTETDTENSKRDCGSRGVIQVEDAGASTEGGSTNITHANRCYPKPVRNSNQPKDTPVDISSQTYQRNDSKSAANQLDSKKTTVPTKQEVPIETKSKSIKKAQGKEKVKLKRDDKSHATKKTDLIDSLMSQQTLKLTPLLKPCKMKTQNSPHSN